MTSLSHLLGKDWIRSSEVLFPQRCKFLLSELFSTSPSTAFDKITGYQEATVSYLLLLMAKQCGPSVECGLYVAEDLQME